MAWHTSQRRQARQRRQKALQTAPQVMLRGLLAEWGVTSLNSLKIDERHQLAAGLAHAVTALLVGHTPPPPGL